MDPDDIRRRTAGIRLAAIDIDGTCLKSSKELTTRTQKDIQSLIDGGILVVPATGRGYTGLLGEGNTLPVEGVKYVISLNGALVIECDTGNVIWKKPIVKTEAADFAGEAMIPGNRVGVNFDDNGVRRLNGSCDGNFGPRPNRQGMLIEDVTGNIKEKILSYGYDVLKMNLVFSGPARFEYYKELIAEKYPDMSAYRADTVYMEFSSLETSKGIALEKLAEYLGIGREEIFAVGDYENDISMIRYAGLGVAMGNALDEVKESADVVIGNNNDEGLASFLEEYFL